MQMYEAGQDCLTHEITGQVWWHSLPPTTLTPFLVSRPPCPIIARLALLGISLSLPLRVEWEGVPLKRVRSVPRTQRLTWREVWPTWPTDTPSRHPSQMARFSSACRGGIVIHNHLARDLHAFSLPFLDRGGGGRLEKAKHDGAALSKYSPTRLMNLRPSQG